MTPTPHLHVTRTPTATPTATPTLTTSVTPPAPFHARLAPPGFVTLFFRTPNSWSSASSQIIVWMDVQVKYMAVGPPPPPAGVLSVCPSAVGGVRSRPPPPRAPDPTPAGPVEWEWLTPSRFSKVSRWNGAPRPGYGAFCISGHCRGCSPAEGRTAAAAYPDPREAYVGGMCVKSIQSI